MFVSEAGALHEEKLFIFALILLQSGDAVLFRRGDLFRGNLKTFSGVIYGAYGEGEKPIISASEENGAVESNWSLV